MLHRFAFRDDRWAFAEALTSRTGGRLQVRFCPGIPIPDPRSPDDPRCDRLSRGWVFLARIAGVDPDDPAEGLTSFTVDARRGDVAEQLAGRLRSVAAAFQDIARAIECRPPGGSQ